MRKPKYAIVEPTDEKGCLLRGRGLRRPQRTAEEAGASPTTRGEGQKVDRVVCRGDPSLGTKQAFKIKLELSPPSATLREKDCFKRFNLVNVTCLTLSENLEKYLGQREEGYLWSNTIMQADTFQRFRLQAFRIFFLYATTFYCLNYANL